jgi:YHS domain-containing protein
MIGKTMTAPRRQRKLGPPLSRRNLLAALATLGALASVREAYAATTEQIVVDGRTGLAISGFDPVAYFVDGAAKPGKDVFEQVFAGVTWRFCNEGNQAAFAADPDVYMPRFGGYDPVGIARGVTVAGDPRVWSIIEGRLYLFYSPEDRAAFTADAEDVIATAERQWPAVQRTLSP